MGRGIHLKAKGREESACGLPTTLVVYSYEGVDKSGRHLYSVCTTDANEDGPHDCFAEIRGATEDEARERAAAFVVVWNRRVPAPPATSEPRPDTLARLREIAEGKP